MTDEEFKAALARLRETARRWNLAHPKATSMPLPPPGQKPPPPHFADTEKDEEAES